MHSLPQRAFLRAETMAYGERQLGICGGKPDERKDLSNSLRNDSLLDKLVDEMAKGKAMEKIKRTNK